jgi:hypothetical protein
VIDLRNISGSRSVLRELNQRVNKGLLQVNNVVHTAVRQPNPVWWHLLRTLLLPLPDGTSGVTGSLVGTLVVAEMVPGACENPARGYLESIKVSTIGKRRNIYKKRTDSDEIRLSKDLPLTQTADWSLVSRDATRELQSLFR